MKLIPPRLAFCDPIRADLQQNVASRDKALGDRQAEFNLMRRDLGDLEALHSSCGSRSLIRRLLQSAGLRSGSGIMAMILVVG